MSLLALILAAASIVLLPAVANAELQTWVHPNAEANDSTAVADGNVRRSTVYDVWVATHEVPDLRHESFTYMSVPRNGRAKDGYSDDDGAEFAAQAQMSMSWTSFLYDADAWVYVSIKQGPDLRSADEVTIRPSWLRFQKELVDARTIRILVPYSTLGFRFSVEFASANLTSYKDASGALTTAAPGNLAIHTEPRNAMLVFAEARLVGADADRLVPNPAAQAIYYPAEGKISDLHEVTAEVIYFNAGVYFMGSNYHAYLQPTVRWIYLAPGAYVKGAFQFQIGATDLKVTGFGVLSGEQYVYEPDRANGYRHRSDRSAECNRTCIKMLEFAAGRDQARLTVHGITVANPPYHSFVVYGDLRHFTADMSQAKQVGAWYWQTDGPELYESSTVAHSFIHANDDVLKLYASHAQVHDIVIWKGENGPVFQWGWAPRNLDEVHVNGVDIIHNRMHLDSHNACIINSARHFRDPSSRTLADPRTRVTNLFLENIRAEGKNLCAMRLYALSSWENIRIENLWIEEWNELGLETQASQFEALSNPYGERVFIGNEVWGGRGVAIVNYYVGGEHVTKAAENWRSFQTGRLDFDASLWENWDAR